MTRPAPPAAAALLALGAAACVAPDAGPAASQPATVNGAILPGDGQQTAELDGVPIQVLTYRPPGCAVTGVLLVFHGLERNAAGYRDVAVPLAQRYCMVVAAPLFDAARFPNWSYQRGGIVHGGAVQPPGTWTVNFVPRLVAWARGKEGRPDLPYALIGHSAGAQFLSRVAAFSRNDATRTILANPSTWVRPSLDVAAPYGFGEAYAPAQGEAALRAYLAENIIVLLGREDTRARNLATSEEAEDQGGTRLERGRNVFQEAEQAAQQHGWAFNWRLAVVPGVGHNARAMFTSDQAFAALRP